MTATESKVANSILLVEDFRMMAKQMQRFLENQGYQVTLCSDGVEAVHELQKGKDRFFCAVLDLGLPRLDGFGVLKWLNIQKIEIPVIVMSGQINHEVLMELTRFQVSHILSKPVPQHTLLEKVNVLAPKPKRNVDFISGRNETLNLLSSFLDSKQYELNWIEGFDNVGDSSNRIKIFQLGIQDRNFEEILDGVSWESFTSSHNFLIAPRRVVEFSKKFEGVFNKSFPLPLNFDELKICLDSIVFPDDEL